MKNPSGQDNDHKKKPFSLREWLFGMSVDRKVFWLGLLLAIVFIAGWAVYCNIPWLSGMGECRFKKATGLYCPGCGGTRAVRALHLPSLCTVLRHYVARLRRESSAGDPACSGSKGHEVPRSVCLCRDRDPAVQLDHQEYNAVCDQWLTLASCETSPFKNVIMTLILLKALA